MAQEGRPAGRPRTGRAVVWSAVVVAIAWLAIGGVAGPLSGKLSEVQTNDNASFLPASAESTIVAEAQKKFSDSSSLPWLLVFSNPDGSALTPEQLATAGTTAADLPTTPVPGGTVVGDYLSPGPLVVVPAEDGKAALLVVPVTADKVAGNLANGELAAAGITEALRDRVADVSGVQVNVAGPGGILGDLISVFGAIDTTLLAATAVVVAIILMLVYRSPFVWVIPLLSAGMALSAASAVVYVLAKNDIVVLNGQSQGILTVLVFGAGTDYALLLVARYREELHRHALHTEAMKKAWRGVLEPIVASCATTSIGLMCLLLSQLNSNRSIGPVSAAGIVAAMIVMLTFLPALLIIPSVVLPILAFLLPTVVGLVLGLFTDVPLGPFAVAGGLLAAITVLAWVFFGVMRVRRPEWGPFSRVRFPAGRWAFWPRVPIEGEPDEKMSGLWFKLSRGVGRRPRVTWIVTMLVLLGMAAFAPTLKADGITTTEVFVNQTDSVTGQQVLAAHFAGGLGTPTVVLTDADAYPQVLAAVKGSPGIAQATPYTGAPAIPGVPAGGEPKVVDGRAIIDVTLADAPDSQAGEEAVRTLRENVHAVPGANALVGGQTAAQLDVDKASRHDRNLIIPVVLVVIFLILLVLLRSLVAPIVLIATVVLSYLATLGICAVMFNDVFDFAGADVSFPLFAFVFLVALGVDYNIFLMTRVREESTTYGTRPGILRGLTATGGVITSAGIVLAATFLVLGVLPLVVLRQIGFAVALGVLIDTFIVRSTLVPALSYDIGRRIWWPSALSRQDPPPVAGDPFAVDSRQSAPAGDTR